MAKKVLKEDTFIDEVSGISYKWLKEETEQVNSISCWSAKDQWGNKDYFVVKEGKILKGPYKSVKETCTALEEGLNEDVEADAVEEEQVVPEERMEAGFVDSLRDISLQVTELIRKCESLAQWFGEAPEYDELVAVLNDIVGVENENIGKVQAMVDSLNGASEDIEAGQDKAEQIMQEVPQEEEDTVFEIDDIDEFETPPMPIGYSNITPPSPPVVSAPDDVSSVIASRFALDDEEDEDIIGF